MYRVRIARQQAQQWPKALQQGAYSKRSYVTNAEIESARKYCVDQLRKSDYDSYLIRNFIPKFRQDAYDALRAFNLELVRLPELVSNPTIGQMRMQFWRDAVNNTFAGKPPKGQPIMILLHKVLRDLAEQFPGPGEISPNSIKFWMLRVIGTREKYMDNRPFTDLAALEEYAENTYSTLMYSTLAALPIQSMHVDHLASHIGKACGIVAVLRGVPFLAAPSPPVQSPSGSDVVGGGRNPVLLLPLDVMAEAGLREEDVYRQGPQAEGFQDAIFKVATRANDHLITAREMLKKLQAGEDPGHEYEHQGEAEHNHIMEDSGDSTKRDIRRGFGVLLEGVPASDYLARLEATNFDPFAVRSGGWKLPWRIWRAMKTQKL
ncbi:putative ribosomal protein MRP17- mitochondrial [Apiospora arundinis]